MSDKELVVDADGHIWEPADLWEEYIDPKYRDRAIRFKFDEHGQQYVELDGKPSVTLNAAVLAAAGSMRKLGELGETGIREVNAERRSAMAEEVTKEKTEAKWFVNSMGFYEGIYDPNYALGAGDPGERVQACDRDGIDKVILYPSLSLNYESEVKDPTLLAAYFNAYNRWIADFCRDSKGRLVPVAHLTLGDPADTARELRRAVKDGCKGAVLAPFTITRKPHGHSDHDVVFETAQELDVPITIHPMRDLPEWGIHHRFDGTEWSDWYNIVLAVGPVQQAFASMFAFGVFDRFPRLKVGVVESAAGWMASFLERCDTVYEKSIMGSTILLKEKPSFYFKRQMFISADPDERTISEGMRLLGEDKFLWASDYPHSDHSANYMELLPGLVERMTPNGRRGILGENAARIYNLT